MREEFPIFVVNGFLDSGKTALIKTIITGNENLHNTTVVIATEEGEEEYDKAWCEQTGVHVEFVSEQAELTPEFMEDLISVYRPRQIVIEYNSFWDYEDQDFPDYMVIYQQITMIDSSSFGVMFNNMKKIFNTMVKYSSMIIFNRCDNDEAKLASYRRQIRMFNPNAEVAFERADGTMYTGLEEDLPYDLNKPEVIIGDEDYPIWYMEVFDRKDKYFNRSFRFKTFVRDITDTTFVCGREVMTCCADDIQFLGFEVINKSDYKPEIGDCIYITCTPIIEYSYLAKEDVVMLKATQIAKLPNQKEEVIGF